MRILIGLAGLIGLLVFVTLGAMIWIRLAPTDPVDWHAYPAAELRSGKPNDFLLAPEGGDATAPVYAVEAAALAARLDTFVLHEPRTERLAGSAERGLVTYLQRSLVMGFPDYVTVAFQDLEDGKSTLTIWSRSRFGYSDLGVNEGRVRRWIEFLEPLAEAG